MLQGCLTTKANCKTFVSDSVQWQANVLSPLRNQQIPWFLILSVLKMAYLFFLFHGGWFLFIFFTLLKQIKENKLKAKRKLWAWSVTEWQNECCVVYSCWNSSVCSDLLEHVQTHAEKKFVLFYWPQKATLRNLYSSPHPELSLPNFFK